MTAPTNVSKAQAADNHHEQGYNCAQSVLLAFAEELGLPPETAIRAAGSFGGGMGRQGMTCGALTGGMLVIGLRHAAQDPKDDAAKERINALVQRFTAAFRAEHGATDCAALLGIDVSNAEERARAKEQGIFKARCPFYIQGAARWLEENA